MGLNIRKKIDIKLTLVVVVLAILAVFILLACVDNYKERRAAERQQGLVIAAQRAEAAAVKKAVHDASINRLVSICMIVQEQYDRSTPKERVGKVRPDCSVVE